MNLYFENNLVEKDVQAIKSAIELRPIHQCTDVKLRAHVTVCMLALLTQRILADRLKAKAVKMSPASALEALATTHLNLVTNGPMTAWRPLDADPRCIVSTTTFRSGAIPARRRTNRRKCRHLGELVRSAPGSTHPASRGALSL
ncbi:MAG: hypothetical protein Q8P41_15325 [Pseudomonadota bacterium]|nr:hypothetical protein [Pseudomonadota bacterium]